VRFFASLAERAGRAEETLEVDPAWDLHELWRQLMRRHPALGEAVRPLVACDRVRSSWERSLAGVSEVAFLPPYSGG
jgi:molybdopterin converting factor small subunit